VRGETETKGWRVGRGERGDLQDSLWVTHKGSMARERDRGERLRVTKGWRLGRGKRKEIRRASGERETRARVEGERYERVTRVERDMRE